MAREKERELRELERATRTIFVFNLSLKVDERDLFEFFSKVPAVLHSSILHCNSRWIMLLAVC